MDRMRALIEDCCGWNRKTWADAVEFAVATLPVDLSGYSVLEIGASDRSTLAPLFVAKGADVVCSYYRKPKDLIENGSLRRICSKYGLASPPVQEMDITDLQGNYDVVVMKSVLGGVCRSGDYKQIRSMIQKISKSLSIRGLLLTIDNGYIEMFERLRTALGTGGNTWTYIQRDNFAESLAGFDTDMAGFGFLNCATASLQIGFNAEFVNDLAHHADKLVARVFRPTERAVFSTVIRALPVTAP